MVTACVCMYLGVLRRYLQRERHAVGVEVVVERDECAVHAALRQVVRVLLEQQQHTYITHNVLLPGQVVDVVVSRLCSPEGGLLEKAAEASWEPRGSVCRCSGTYLEVDGDEPALQPLVGPHEYVPGPQLCSAPSLLQRADAVANALQTRYAEEGSQTFPIHSWFMSPKASAAQAVPRGADGDVSDTISWIASLSFSRCSGLLIPGCKVPHTNLPLYLLVGERGHDGPGLDVGPAGGDVPGRHADPELEPGDDGGPVPQRERRARAHRLAQQLVPSWRSLDASWERATWARAVSWRHCCSGRPLARTDPGTILTIATVDSVLVGAVEQFNVIMKQNNLPSELLMPLFFCWCMEAMEAAEAAPARELPTGPPQVLAMPPPRDDAMPPRDSWLELDEMLLCGDLYVKYFKYSYWVPSSRSIV
ncbi:hypothetical protein HW555_001719 [Spodoptera exigua]|uniref:Uncharacterized protein n=1 Tax=Spodoptera exigua TaxID=7107 RepID=A0A835GTP0_SPOEX|nr:hypothetical protein HW555_001719 [Spodoptera exigua]